MDVNKIHYKDKFIINYRLNWTFVDLCRMMIKKH